MTRIAFLLVAVVTVGGVIATMAHAAGQADGQAAPIFVTKIPAGYRDWRLISVAREEGTINDIRAILGNDAGIKAYRTGTLPFPDDAIIARIAWSYDPSEENNKIFGRSQSFVAGPPKNGVQFMVKGSRKYASTGGWGFAQFDDGKPADEAALKTCFPCHAGIKARDLVFTHYAPWGKNMKHLQCDRKITALVVIDPYNDFISEGGKHWDRLKTVSEANHCVPHMLQVMNAVRKA
jgi:Cytochrome P460